MSDTAILALDPSTNFGFCLRLPDNTKHFGTWDLGKSMPPPVYHLKLWKEMSALLNQHDLMSADVLFVVEKASFNKQGSSHGLSESWMTVVGMFAITYGFRLPKDVIVNSWRSAFLTHNKFLPSSNPPKEIKGAEARSAWLKSKVIEKCHTLGLYPDDNNAADAIGIAFWALTGGIQRQTDNREATKAKKKAKRSQGKLNLDAA